MKKYKLIGCLSISSIILLSLAFLFLSSLGALAQNKPAHDFVTELLAKDSKVQRDAAKGQLRVNLDQTATNLLSYIDQYKMYPLAAIGF